jgi:uncharacterized protein RhaS with RHS repeats
MSEQGQTAVLAHSCLPNLFLYGFLATDTTFNYDATGNRTTVIDGGGSTRYVTNAMNQYTSVNNTQYLYDKGGNRVKSRA